VGGGERVGELEVDSVHVDLHRGLRKNLLHLPDLKQTPPSERSTRTGAAVRRSQPVRPEKVLRSGGYNGAPQVAVRVYYDLTLGYCQIRVVHACYGHLDLSGLCFVEALTPARPRRGPATAGGIFDRRDSLRSRRARPSGVLQHPEGFALSVAPL
jgi:hypothetical protein